MIFLLAMIVFLFLFLLIYLRFKHVNVPATYFLVWWVSWVMVSQTNIFGLFSVSADTYLLVLAKITMFTVGFLLVARARAGSSRWSDIKPISRSMVLTQLALTGLLLMYLQRYNAILSQASIVEARLIRFELGAFLRSGFEAAFYNYVVAMLVMFFLLYFVSRTITTRSFDAAAGVAVVNALIYGLIGLGRFVYFDTGLFIVLGLLLTAPLRKQRGYSANRIGAMGGLRRKIVWAGAFFVVVFGMAYTTALRLGVRDLWVGVRVLFEQFVVYFLGPFRALDVYLATFARDFSMLFGRATFAGIDELFMSVLYVLGWGLGPINFHIGGVTQQQILIGDGSNSLFNAFYTSIMNFHMDFGVLGVFFLPMLYGMAVARAYNLYQRRPSVYTLMLIVFLSHASIVSQLRWPFQAPHNWLILFLIGSTILYESRATQRCGLVSSHGERS